MSFYLGAYWGPRRESVEQCAHRLTRCLNAIARYSPTIGEWYHERETARGPSPRRENWVLVPQGESKFEELLRKGVNRNDGTGDPIPELGFGTSFWNRRDDAEGGAGCSTFCGAWSKHLASPNNFLLRLPKPASAPELYKPHTARALVEAVADCWEPDWATWTNQHLRDLQDEHVTEKSLNWASLKPGDVLPDGVAKPLGWATYFSTPLEPPDNWPSGAQLHELGAGSLLMIGDNPADVPEDLLLAVRDLLGETALA